MNSGSSNPFSSVAILGPGLIGGSLAMAIRKYMPGVQIRLWARRKSPLNFAREHKLADICSQGLLGTVKGADLIVLCTPTGTFLDLAKKFERRLGGNAVVTDVGSTKEDVHAGVGSFLKESGHIFVGSHPMAGSEKQGIEHAQANLFENAVVALTNENQANDAIFGRVACFWRRLGASVFQTNATHHDSVVAAISHAPHIFAALAARAAMPDDGLLIDHLRVMASTGFRDTTRVCSGSPALWRDILTQNSEAICPYLERSIADQQRVLRLLREKNSQGLQQWLTEAKKARESIC